MSLERWFRLSSYVTLGLSCTALVFAEAAFLPDLPVCLAPVLMLLVLAWWVEGRWTLPAWGANVLGALIAAGGAAWLMMHLSDRDSWQAKVPLYLVLVPYTGPLLMAALLVKLFRPRRGGDFWLLQGLGLMQVSLGCVLAGGPEFGALLAAYLTSALACLALHYRLSAPAEGGGWRAAGWLLGFTFRWALGVAALALVLFLLTPRRPDAGWDARANFIPETNRPARLSAGVGEEINLNRTGTLELDDEVAVRVAAIDAVGRPKRDLPADQRWRGAVLDWYSAGKWSAVRQTMPFPHTLRGQQGLPDFGSGQYYLSFTIRPARAGGLVLAEPIGLGPPEARLPVIPEPGAGRHVYFTELAGTVLPLMFSPRMEYQYRQVIPPRADPARTPAEPLPDRYVEGLQRENVLGLREWTLDLLRRLSARPDYRLPDDVRATLGRPGQLFAVEAEHREAVARALTRYLAASGEYTYTLVITRQDLTVDPVMDFLVNLKRGHCERYATALALMLRSVGIPARVVKGFRGADQQGDGVYVVRHSHAHAWVEALVPRRDGPGEESDWLMLDPTPADSSPASDSFSLSHWWQEGERSVLELWRTLIVDYNADEQADLWDSLKPGRRRPTLLKLGLLLVVVPAALTAFVVVRRRVRRRRADGRRSAEAVAFYARLIALLGRHLALRPQAGQTPREYGEMARRFLRALPGSAALADLPGRVAEMFYRVRFGGRPLSEPESQALNAELDRLAAALRQTGRR